jgi:3-methyladenine DNA glycosylase AlkD
VTAGLDAIMEEMRSNGSERNREGMARYGIDATSALGLSMPYLRNMAKRMGKDHELAQQLWSTKVHEALILAALIDIPSLVTEAQMESWVRDFDSWDVCDQCCSILFSRTPFAYRKAEEWTRREETFVKRAGYVLMAALAVHDKKAGDTVFLAFLPLIKEGASDQRNFVRKAVNWALRQIGKRNLALNKEAIVCAEEIAGSDDATSRWVASDALRELRSEAVQTRLSDRER